MFMLMTFYYIVEVAKLPLQLKYMFSYDDDIVEQEWKARIVMKEWMRIICRVAMRKCPEILKEVAMENTEREVM